MLIDVQDVREDEQRLLERRWDSDLGRMLAHQARSLRGREGDPALSPDQEGEVISHLVATAGPRAVEDLRSRLAEVEARIATAAAHYSPSYAYPEPLRDTLPVVAEQVRLARRYRARLAAMLAALGEPDAGEPDDRGEADEVHAVLLASGGQRFVDDLRAHLAPAAEELRARLDLVVGELDVTHGRHAGGGFDFGVREKHDGAWGRYAWLVWRRQDLEARIASLDQDRAKAAAVQARLTREAIEAAGGADVVARGVRDSWRMCDQFHRGHPRHGEMRARAAGVEAVDAELAKLGGPGATGPVADSLRADRAAAAAAADASRAAVEGEMEARIAGLVAGAIAGDESARAEIERAARDEPRAFRAGFADAIADAQFERSQLGALVHSMIETSGRQLVPTA